MSKACLATLLPCGLIFCATSAWPLSFTGAAALSGCLAYQGLLKSYGAVNYWPLGEASGTVAKDVIGANTGTYVNVTPATMMGQPGFSPVRNNSVSFSNASSTQVTTTTSYASPQNLSVLVWFKTTTTLGGVIVQFSNTQTGTPSSYDRHIYMQDTSGTAGAIDWGVYPTAVKTIPSAAPVLNDGNWHMAIGVIGTAGQTLFVDQRTPVTVATVTTAQVFTGYWRIGYGDVSGWTTPPAKNYFTGNIASVAYFTSQLTQAQANEIYAVGMKCGP